MRGLYFKIFIVVLVICTAGVVGAYIGLRATERNDAKSVVEPEPEKNQFAWGVNTSAFQIDNYNQETAQKQIDIIKDLGVNTVRVFLERKIELDPYSVQYYDDANDDFIDKLNSAGVDVVLIIDGDIIGTAGKTQYDQEQLGYEMASRAAIRYKGKVKYYQIANEVTGTTVKPSDPEFKDATFKGETGLEYSIDRYDSALKWLKGMSKGIRENDPDAKIIVSGHWVLHDVIKKMIDDGLDFDILGWAWYSEDGLDINKRSFNDQNINLFQILNDIGKPVWIIESNQHQGSYGEGDLKKGEKDQSEFIRNFINLNYEKGLFDGYIVYTLFDAPTFADKNRKEQDAHWGLVAVDKDGNNHPVFHKKEAFYTYKTIIARLLK